MCEVDDSGNLTCVDVGGSGGVFATEADCQNQCLGYWFGMPRWVWYTAGGVAVVLGIVILFVLYELVIHAPVAQG